MASIDKSGERADSEDELPAYESDCYPRPVTVEFLLCRYHDLPTKVSVGPAYLPTGIWSSVYAPQPPYLSVGWSMHINPEGAPYYVNDALSIVTDVPLHMPELCQEVDWTVKKIQDLVKMLGITLPQNHEIYVGLRRSAALKAQSCYYYLVDHDTQIEFWLQNVDTPSLNLPQVTSERHLRYKLQEHYWRHVELFPHRPIKPRLQMEVLDILRHARGDQLTSMDSTFPWEEDRCDKFIQLITTHSSDNLSAYATCLIARIWAAICESRFINFYGEDHARLGRFQAVLVDPGYEKSLASKLIAPLLFGLTSRTISDLERLFNDRVITLVHWRKFIRNAMDEWNRSSKLSALLFTVNALLLTGHNVDGFCAGLASTILSMGSLISGIILLHTYSTAPEISASVAVNHIQNVEHPRWGFERIAAIYNLPKALGFWSFGFLTIDILLKAVDLGSLSAKTIVLSIAGFLGLIIGGMIIMLLRSWASPAASTDDVLVDAIPGEATEMTSDAIV